MQYQALLKSSFVSIRLFSAAAWRMTPSLPQRGEAAQGEHPLDSLFFLGYISTLSGVIAIGGMPERRGRKHEKLEAPRAIVCLYEDFNRARYHIWFSYFSYKANVHYRVSYNRLKNQ